MPIAEFTEFRECKIRKKQVFYKPFGDNLHGTKLNRNKFAFSSVLEAESMFVNCPHLSRNTYHAHDQNISFFDEFRHYLWF